MDIMTILVALIVAALCYYVASIFLPAPWPTVIALVILLLALTHKLIL